MKFYKNPCQSLFIIRKCYCFLLLQMEQAEKKAKEEELKLQEKMADERKKEKEMKKIVNKWINYCCLRWSLMII